MTAHVPWEFSDLKSLLGFFGLRSCLVLLAPVVFSLELFNATSRVDELHLTSEKGVRSRRNFDLKQRVFVTVFPLVFFFALDRRLQQETSPVGSVLEDDIPIFRVDALFHWCVAFSASASRWKVHRLSGSAEIEEKFSNFEQQSINRYAQIGK
jgi:hypothetical protein